MDQIEKSKYRLQFMHIIAQHCCGSMRLPPFIALMNSKGSQEGREDLRQNLVDKNINDAFYRKKQKFVAYGKKSSNMEYL